MNRPVAILVAGLLSICPQVLAAQTVADEPDFNREVRPILAAKCFACHGPDEDAREAELRLDERESALDSGVIIPGKPDDSELVARIFATDDSQMPPQESGESLSDTEKKILRSWVQSGASYAKHWAFVPPVRKPLPRLEGADNTMKDWITNPIDHFVLNKLLEKKLRPSKPADPYTLVRRVYLDLIGLPPTPEQADQFAKDSDPNAYTKLVDQLLDSKHYGERWARPWLDLARYADTNGYEKDRPRSIWPYRDWVIQAINQDMPFDQFTIEQLAGDMLENASNSQKIATGFHRNTMLNEEGGIDPLEYRFYAMVDRVATTGTVWMGLTVGCAQCHSHKYDPISHTDYYRMMALLNNANEPDLAVKNPGFEQARTQAMRKIEQAEKKLEEEYLNAIKKEASEKGLDGKRFLQNEVIEWVRNQRKNAARWQVVRPTRMTTNLPKLSLQQDNSIFASGDFTKRDVYELSFDLKPDVEVGSIRLEVLPDSRLPANGPGNAYYEGRKGDFFLSEFVAKVDDKEIRFKDASTTYGKISIGSGTAAGTNVYDNEGSTGWSTSGQEGQRNVLVLNLDQPVAGKSLQVKMIFERHFVASLGRFRLSISRQPDAKANRLPGELERLIVGSGDQADQLADLSPRLIREFLLSTPRLKESQQRLAQMRNRLPQPVQTMVMQERDPDNPRTTHRYHRGEYLNQREVVQPQLPSLFPPLGKDVEPNRLNFAKWLVSSDNPLAARVAVNRNWQELFGRGLVDSAGDFGTQSPPPSHPELLDWLAIYFQEQGWSRKKLHRLIVTSSTYRQSSLVGAEKYKRDPANEFLARGPRFRVHAEYVRDIVLAASGKLSTKMFGPSVYPPQPPSVTAIAYGNTRWPVSKGEDRYRRSIYTFSKRTAPFAAYLTFNSPTGENCVARRNRSNTPLQALTILNDQLFVELAQSLAQKALSESDSKDVKKTATFVFRRLLTRPPTSNELRSIESFYQQQVSRLNKGELKAAEIAGDNATPELAAWTLVARSLISLDEVITKQ